MFETITQNTWIYSPQDFNVKSMTSFTKNCGSQFLLKTLSTTVTVIYSLSGVTFVWLGLAGKISRLSVTRCSKNSNNNVIADNQKNNDTTMFFFFLWQRHKVQLYNYMIRFIKFDILFDILFKDHISPVTKSYYLLKFRGQIYLRTSLKLETKQTLGIRLGSLHCSVEIKSTKSRLYHNSHKTWNDQETNQIFCGK